MKPTTNLLLLTAIFLSACGSSVEANCPAGFTCVPNTPTPSRAPLPTETPMPTLTPVVTPMLESLAAFGLKLKFPFQVANWQRYEFDYYKSGWASNNPHCRIREDGVLESDGFEDCVIYPFPGLLLAARVNAIDKALISLTLGSYGAEIQSVIPDPSDTEKEIVTWEFE